MKINIELDTFDKQLNSKLFNKKIINSGDKIDIFRNTSLYYQLTLKKFSINEPETIVFTLDITGNLSTNISIFSTWLYENVRTNAIQLRINQTDIEINENIIKCKLEDLIH
jgi:hypothetical protein